MMQWVYNSGDDAPALVLARAGFDFWLGNNRGNRWSDTHVNMTNWRRWAPLIPQRSSATSIHIKHNKVALLQLMSEPTNHAIFSAMIDT
jgi:hypothetical protein